VTSIVTSPRGNEEKKTQDTIDKELNEARDTLQNARKARKSQQPIRACKFAFNAGKIFAQHHRIKQAAISFSIVIETLLENPIKIGGISIFRLFLMS
jgi:hypothetical protein